nr:zinc finger, CCHC-type [Tanacetum cinerariifolium]
MVALSSAEAEFRGIANGITEFLWVRRLLTEIGYSPQEPTKIFSDNKAAIQISENPVQHDRTKHIEVDRHFIKEKVEAKIITLLFVRSKDQLVDILTKAVNEKNLHKCLGKLNFGNPQIVREGIQLGLKRIDKAKQNLVEFISIAPFMNFWFNRVESCICFTTSPSSCKTAKELRESLKKRHVGEEKVQQARLQSLMIGFNTLQMKDDDTVDAFTAKLNGYATKAKELGKTLDESLLVRKLLESTPDRFIQIVASIEKTSDLDDITLDEITGKLKAFKERIKLRKGGKVFLIRVKELTGWAPSFNDDPDSDDESVDSQEASILKDEFSDKNSDMKEIPESVFDKSKHVGKSHPLVMKFA